MEYQLGKKPHKVDKRTVKLENFMAPITIPTKYDFDSGRASFPIPVWGNDKWGDCVIVGRGHHLLRLERLEQRRTLKLSDKNVIDEYKKNVKIEMGGEPVTPGDYYDAGLVILDAMKEWRKLGWRLTNHTYQISAFGELRPNDVTQVKQAIYLLHGVEFGLALPLAAQKMTNQGVWDYNGQTSGDWHPGSWGGHCVYAKAYDSTSVEVLTWGMKIRMTNAFLKRYSDEAWAVVDKLDTWRNRPEIDVQALLKYLKDIGAIQVG